MLGNVSLTNLATKSAIIDAGIVTITGSSYLNATQPQTSGVGAVIDATLTSGFIAKDLRATTSGPGAVTTALNLNTLIGKLQATSRGTAGDQIITSTSRINNDVRITATGLDSSQSDLKDVLGSALPTITGTTFANLKAATMKSSIITITGASVATIDAATVTESLTVTMRDVDSGFVRSTGSIGTDLRVTSNNVSTTVAVNDVGGNLSVNSTNTDNLNVTAENVTQTSPSPQKASKTSWYKLLAQLLSTRRSVLPTRPVVHLAPPICTAVVRGSVSPPRPALALPPPLSSRLLSDQRLSLSPGPTQTSPSTTRTRM